ncbi:MAG: IS66 family transposase [Acidimicrobiales bacterium]
MTAPASRGRLGPDKAGLLVLTKARLIAIILEQREEMRIRLEEKDMQIAELKRQLAKPQGEIDKEKAEQKIKDINKHVNQPTSKKPEWDKDGNPKLATWGEKKKTNKKKKRKKRTGCGNPEKTGITPDGTHFNLLASCPCCGNDLGDRKGRVDSGRMVEDTSPPAEKTTVFKEVTESKWCGRCKKMVSSTSERALPGSDIGLNAMIEMAYLWVMCALSFPKIRDLFVSFKTLRLSTAGISKIMIRLNDILQPVYEEILNDVKQGTKIWADETGWRVKGKLWWLWIFANERSAYYWPDKTRGRPVVERLLGEVFLGILIVDGWHAYTKIVCDRQTCMAHIFRKIRAFINAFPQYRSIMKFYLKLRRIIKDGEKLQAARDGLSELVFQRRLSALKQRLDALLEWKNPNDTLKEVIKKVRRQKEHILTFIKHEGAPYHNNYGEYIIKKGVVKRKMSGGSMSAEGVSAYACIQSVAMTCQLRNISFHRFLKASLVCYIRTGRPMLLAEYESGLKPVAIAA